MKKEKMETYTRDEIAQIITKMAWELNNGKYFFNEKHPEEESEIGAFWISELGSKLGCDANLMMGKGFGCDTEATRGLYWKMDSLQENAC